MSGAAATSPSERNARLAELLDRVRAGESGALEPIVRELNPLLWHVARSQGLSAHDAADVVQTTWLGLVRKADQIHTPAALTGWLVSVTKREAWHYAKRAARQEPTEDVGVDAVAADPELDAGLLADERAVSLMRGFRQLTERCQELLKAVAMADRPDYAAISEALGMPHGSIGPTRGRCLAKLRALLLTDPLWSRT
ncbi:RNA polymerase sigma factor [Nocardioides speluncae]|uniref:RNA polymerase sigma factor n=1 Tax=Nocardioides speluncae TaxID=2670337 RepID=UPI000D68AF09|nr:sigma-70 family RNA polymerase sigma factor [Nocardioides speluncae]